MLRHEQRRMGGGEGHGTRGPALAQVHGVGWGMEELLSSGSNRKEKAAGRWLLTRPVEDGGLRQGSSGSWSERGRGKDGSEGMHSLGGSGKIPRKVEDQVGLVVADGMDGMDGTARTRV